MGEQAEDSTLTVLEDKPSDIDLDHISKDVGDKWRSLLTHLGVPLAKSKVYLQESLGNPVSACLEGLVYWREGNKPCKEATWRVLLEALEEGAERRDYARKLHEDIIEGVTTQSPFTSVATQRPFQFRPPSTHGEPTCNVSTMDVRSKKIKTIVDKYRNGEGELYLPSNPELEDKFDDIMGILDSMLLRASSADRRKLCSLVRLKYRRYYNPGVRPAALPPVPDTARGLYDFIAKKSTAYETLLVHHAVEVLSSEDEELKGKVQNYESKLRSFLEGTLTSCKRRAVTLPQYPGHTHLAVVLSKEQVLLSLMLHMKDYFSKYLHLEECLFEGFGGGCTVLLFAIPDIDAALLAPIALSHLAEMKRLFDITHFIIFNHFGCDLGMGTFELLNVPYKSNEFEDKVQVEHELIAAKLNLRLKQLELDRCEEELQMFRNSTIRLAKEKFQLESELVKLRGEKMNLEESAKKNQELREVTIKKIEKPACRFVGSEKSPRNWKDMKCQKILECGGVCRAVSAARNFVATDGSGYVKVYKKTSNDVSYTIGKGQLSERVCAITMYGEDNIFVSDTGNCNVKMFNIHGQHVRTLEREGWQFTPLGLTTSSDGCVYVCDFSHHCICVFRTQGKFLFSFGSYGSGDECFNWPSDLCFGSDGFLYITDLNNCRICVYDQDGKFIRQFTTMFEPWCIAATDCGHLIVSSFVSHKIMIYTTGGDLVHVFGEQGRLSGQFWNPYGVSVDSDGLIYIADFDNRRIQVY